MSRSFLLRPLFIACAGLFAGAASAAESPSIIGVTTLHDDNALVILAEGFNASRMHTRIWLGADGAPGDITGKCRYYGSDLQTEIVCAFPDGLPAAGSYLLRIRDLRNGLEINHSLTLGATGPQGPQGPAGPAGPMGPQGPMGAQGESGPAGPQGEQGSQGATGPQGEQGPQGDTGAQGEPGAQGPQGEAGATGPQGDTGVQGAQGEQGPQGPQGAQGEQGPVGPQGDTGPQGATGPQGPAGVTGAPGAPGAQGSTSLVRIEPVAAGTTCPQGGLRFLSGRDANGNGELDNDDVEQDVVLCGGRPASL